MPAMTRLAVLSLLSVSLGSTTWGAASISPSTHVMTALTQTMVTSPQKTKKPAKPKNGNDRAERERKQREAAKRAARERQQREAAKRAARERQQREAAKRAERERQQREAAKRAERERQQREAAKRAARERQQREAAQRAARERQQREAAQRAARERQQREAAQRAARERQQREAAQRAARERQQREANQRAVRERQQRDADQRAVRERQQRDADLRARHEREQRDAATRAIQDQKRRDALNEQERMRREADARQKQRRTEPTGIRPSDSSSRIRKDDRRSGSIQITPRTDATDRIKTGERDALNPRRERPSSRSLKDGIVVVQPDRRDREKRKRELSVTSIVPPGAPLAPQPRKPRLPAPRFGAESGWTAGTPVADPLPVPDIIWHEEDDVDSAYSDIDTLHYDDFCPVDHYDVHYTHHDWHCSDDWWHYGTHHHGWRFGYRPRSTWSFFVHGGHGWSWSIGFSTGWRWSCRPYRAARYVRFGNSCDWSWGRPCATVTSWRWHRAHTRYWRPSYAVRVASWSESDCDWAPYRPWRAWYDTNCAPASTIIVRDTVYRTAEPVLYEPVLPAPTLLDAWLALDDGRDHRALEIFTSLLDDHISAEQARFGYAITQGLLGRTRIATDQMRLAVERNASELTVLPISYRLHDRIGELTRVYEEQLALHIDELDALFMIAALNVVNDDATVAYFAISAAERRGDLSPSLAALKNSLTRDW